MAGLDEPLKPVPQVFVADLLVHAKYSDCTCAQELHDLMAYYEQCSVCNTLHQQGQKILERCEKLLQ